MSIYEYVPIQVITFFYQEWEDYGSAGFGDVNGNPFREGTYLSWDEDGDEIVNSSLHNVLLKIIPDDEFRKRVVGAVVDFLDTASETVECDEDLIDMFGLDEAWYSTKAK